jgi:hypothetical protein
VGTRFPRPSRQTLRPTQPPVQWLSCLFLGVKVAGAWRWLPTPSSAKFTQRVELYLLLPSGPSWPAYGEFYLERESNKKESLISRRGGLKRGNSTAWGLATGLYILRLKFSVLQNLNKVARYFITKFFQREIWNFCEWSQNGSHCPASWCQAVSHKEQLRGLDAVSNKSGQPVTVKRSCNFTACTWSWIITAGKYRFSAEANFHLIVTKWL